VAAQANVEKSQASLVQVKADYDRAIRLAQENIMSQQQLDLAKASYDAAKATVAGAVANVTQAEAQMNLKNAAVTVAQTNLNYTVIRSPIDGTVVARNVDVGQTVAASLQAPTIFTIAQDLSKMWVYAKTDESDVGNIKIGEPVTFKVDAFPKATFHGIVNQVRMNATTVQSVVTYDTIVEFANPDLKLFPGMTAYVTIPVATVQNVLKVPNTALRYKPPMTTEQILAAYRQHGIEGAGQRQVPDDRADATSGGPQTTSHAPKADSAVVWIRHADNSFEPVEISLGITDHAFTQITALLKGQLKQGDDVVIRSIVPNESAPGALRR
jgi:HlyD family secretion protein